MDINWTLFAFFNLFIIGLLLLDLGIFHRKSHVITIKESLSWTGVWVSLALLFNAWIYFQPGFFFSEQQLSRVIEKGELAAAATMTDLGVLRAEQFLAGFLIEKALAVDNLFVFMLIFTAFAVPLAYQHKLLFWGILGALIMRGIFIFAGVALIQQFTWIIYVFGAFLVWTGFKMLVPKEPFDPVNHWSVRFARRILPISEKLDGDRFTTRQNGVFMFTPLFLVLILIECTDLVFAVDSIPAILAITSDPFIVYTSNVFAILGLRSLYFALAGLSAYVRYLTYGLSAILVFVGLKMLGHAIPVTTTITSATGELITTTEPFKIPVAISLSVIASILFITVVASVIKERLERRAKASQSTMPANVPTTGKPIVEGK
jgi:tellurite resistance protein TerC